MKFKTCRQDLSNFLNVTINVNLILGLYIVHPLEEKQLIAIAANFSKGVFESATLFDQSVLSAVIWAHVQYSHHQLEVNSQT